MKAMPGTFPCQNHFTAENGRMEQQPLKTEQARNPKASAFTQIAQRHHHESVSQHILQ